MGLKFTLIGLILVIALLYFNQFFLAGLTALILLISALNTAFMPSKQKSTAFKEELDREIKAVSDGAGKKYPREAVKEIAGTSIQSIADNIHGTDIKAGESMIGEPLGFLGQASKNFLDGLSSLFGKKIP
ncbi:MAG: hypothetical protein JW703_01965 [Candidatus Diapherotrites archaeon]|nr:hypothetical protein [Candidatus Diapherotrites archaeon]